MTAPVISLAGVTKRFGGVLALDGVSLDVAAGEILALLGPSGCGKSTLLRLVAGFEEPDEGDLSLEGRSLLGVPPHRRPLNMMFQSYALFPHLSVAANVGYGLEAARMGRAERAARVAELLRLVRLDGLGDRRPAALSGGQRQRVALARALAPNPRVLLLDEPMAALDRALREDTQRELKALQRRLGTAFVLVTHDQEEALALADRVAVMERGRLLQVGTPREVYDAPRSRFVAGFVGRANLLAGTVVACDGGTVRFRLAGGGEVAVRSADRVVPVGGEAALAIRPERIALGPEEGPGLAGRVAAIAFAGPVLHVEVRLADGTLLRADRPHAGAPPPVAPGDAVCVSWATDAAVLLP